MRWSPQPPVPVGRRPGLCWLWKWWLILLAAGEAALRGRRHHARRRAEEGASGHTVAGLGSEACMSAAAGGRAAGREMPRRRARASLVAKRRGLCQKLRTEAQDFFFSRSLFCRPLFSRPVFSRSARV